jgi:hypothetical protein
VGAPESLAEGFPGRVTYRVDFPAAATVRARVTGVDGRAAETAIRISVDGREVLRQSWVAHGADAPAAANPADLAFPVTAGVHTLVIENPGAPGWFELSGVDFGVDVPVLAAVGRRGPDCIAVWLWHRTGLVALAPPPAATGTLRLEDVPPGDWRVVWWDTLRGVAAPAQAIRHTGGRLDLPVPPIDRQAAVILTR